jgi:hypothetical protein
LDKFIHRENLTLFKTRLAEPHDAATHKVLFKLLADEEAKDRNYLGDLYLS